MPKCQFSPAQVQHLDSYLPEYITRLDARAPTKELTLWKQATATKIFASPEFSDLDLAKHPRAKWFEKIVRKYTNYLHQVYKKAHPETVSASDIIKANLLLKFSSVLSGCQLFARDMHDEIVAASKQHVIDKGTNEAGTYQTVLKTMWDGLDADKKIEWDARAEEECGDVEVISVDYPGTVCVAGISADYPARSETLPPYQDVPPLGPESPPSRTSPSPPPQPIKGGKRAREAKNPQDQGHEDGSHKKKRKATVSEEQDHDTAINTRRRSSRQNALPAQTAGTSNLQKKIETKPGKNGPKPRYKGWVVLSESSSDEL
ncbi:hypothetical protein B0H10DRAFT_2446999 [Mycena sp. CBHHK59/15]|nr:hypothetical protein B0H10DRAFT_2446999 [Mycena sp. CBHHK59/15]